MRMTTLCYIEQDGKYLMLHRTKKKKDINKDKWIGVGGHAEEGEGPEECLLREVKEETGLTLTSYRFRGLITFISNECEPELMCLFTADGFTGELITCNEGDLVCGQNTGAGASDLERRRHIPEADPVRRSKVFHTAACVCGRYTRGTPVTILLGGKSHTLQPRRWSL